MQALLFSARRAGLTRALTSRQFKSPLLDPHGQRFFSVHSPLRTCIVGAGPGGFYTAKYLLKSIPSTNIDIVEQLPTPYGLVRFGVAPDHPEVKSVQNDFAAVAQDPRVRFCGNIQIGEVATEGHEGPVVSVNSLRDMYDIVVFAYGAASDKSLGLDNEFELENVASAREFVNWYNGHPLYSNWEPKLASCETAVVVGQGNVAIDCARILTKTTEELATTDIASRALTALREKNSVKKVILLGRRGPVQAAFTMKELRELSKLKDVGLLVREEELVLGDTESSLKEASESRALKRRRDFLQKQAQKFDEEKQKPKSIELRFLSQPVELLRDESSKAVGGIRVEHTVLSGPAGLQSATGTGVFETIPCGLVLKSIGYRSVPIAGVPFDQDRSVVRNTHGRVVDDNGAPVPGLYTSGWVKRGPTGIVGTNITDARDTVDSIVQDFGENAENKSVEKVEVDWDKMFPGKVVSWQGYEALEKVEREAGESASPKKLSEKITNIQEMLQAAQVLK